MSVTSLAIKRPTLFIVFFLVLGGASLFSYQKLNYELLPNLATPIITIYTAYPGASPEEVENSVTKKIEDAVAGAGKSKKLSASSFNNLSVVQLEFLADVNPDLAEQEVQRLVNSARPDLPAGAKPPVLEKFSVNDLPVLKLAVTGAIPGRVLYDLVNNQVKARLAQVKGVGRVKVLGGATREIQVAGNIDKLISNGLSIGDLADRIDQYNIDYPAGNVNDIDAQFGVQVAGKFTNPAQIGRLNIREYPDGSHLTVNDVATVQTGQTTEEVRSRLDGQSAIAMFINKQSGANAVEMAKNIKQELQQIEQEYSAEKITFHIAQDSSEFTLKAAHNVYDDLGIAILLVAAVMLVFLHSIRNALIVMISIPASLFSAFIMLYALDYSLNLMTLLAMSLVIGVLVDDSIVVLENIYHHLELGQDRRTAALEGRNEIGFAALSITLVDVVVFLPMALVPGLVGSLIKEFSLVIVVSTLSSLIVSFTLTPLIASRFARLETLSDRTLGGKAAGWFEKRIDALTAGYGRLLTRGLRYKWIVGGAAVTVLGAALLLLTTNIVGTEFLPQADKGELSLFVDLQPGTALSRTDSTVKIIEDRLKTIPEITRLFTAIGYQNDGFEEKTDPSIATINISLTAAGQRTRNLNELSREIRALSMKVENVKARVSPLGLFGANEAPVQLLVTGADRDSVALGARSVLAAMRNVNGVVSPRLSAAAGKPELRIVADRDKMAKEGLTTGSVGASLRLDLFGNDPIKIREKAKEVDTRVRLEEDQRSQTDQLLRYPFLNADHQMVYLDQFATVNLQFAPSALERRNKRPSMLLLAQVTGRPVGDVGDDIRTAIASAHLPQGIRVLYEGDLEMQDDSFSSLGMALLVSLILIYLIMVALYNDWTEPFVLLFSIPFSLSGALLALALNAKSLNVFSIFGLIMMMGLVVKNGILVVDKTNALLKAPGSTLSVRSALVEAGKARLRPILMTTIAMIIGMLPLAFAQGAAAAFSSGLAWVLIGGLSSSMLLTLVVVPVIYETMYWVKVKLGALRKKQVLILLLSACLLGYHPAKAQTRVELTLRQAVELGLKSNQRLTLAMLDARKASLGLKEAQSYFYPQIGASLQYARNIQPTVFFLPTFSISGASGVVFNDKNLQPIDVSSPNAYNGTVNFSMPLFSKEITENAAAARLNRELANANTELSRWELADDIRKAYFNILIARQNLSLIDTSLDRARLDLRDSRQLLEKGFANRSDTLNAWSNVQLMDANQLKAATSITQAENWLKFLLHFSAGSPLLLADSLDQLLPAVGAMPADDAPAQRDTVPAFLAARPDLKVSESQIALARQQIRTARAGYFPVLSLVSQYSLQAQADNFRFDQYRWPNSFFVGLQLNIPIFSGFRTDARVKQSQVALEQAKVQRDLLESQASLELTNTRLSIAEEAKKIGLQRNVKDARTAALDFIRSRWQKGFAKYSEVADAELLLVQADNDYSQTLFSYLQTLSNYYKLTGHII